MKKRSFTLTDDIEQELNNILIKYHFLPINVVCSNSALTSVTIYTKHNRYISMYFLKSLNLSEGYIADRYNVSKSFIRDNYRKMESLIYRKEHLTLLPLLNDFYTNEKIRKFISNID